MKFNLLSSADLESESEENQKETKQKKKQDKPETKKKKKKKKEVNKSKTTKDTNNQKKKETRKNKNRKQKSSDKQEKEEKKERKKKGKSSDKKEERKEKRQQKQEKKTSKSESNRATSNRRESRSEKKIQPARAKTQNRPDSGSEVLEINLIKNEISVFFDWYKNIALLVVFVFITLVFLGELYWLLYWWQTQGQERIVYSQDAILEVTKDIRAQKQEAQEASIFKEKLSKTTYLLDNHIYWTRFFEMLEDTRVEGVVFTGFEGDIKGEYTIPAKTYNYLNIGKQVNALKQNKYIEEVKVFKAGSLKNKEINQIEFELDIEVSPKIFKQ